MRSVSAHPLLLCVSAARKVVPFWRRTNLMAAIVAAHVPASVG